MRKLFLLAAFLLTCNIAVAQYVPVNGYVSQGGNAVVVGGLPPTPTKWMQTYPGATVSVCVAGTSCATLASIYTSSSGGAKANPFNADSLTALYQFFILPGTYDLRFSGTSGGQTLTPWTITNFGIAGGSAPGTPCNGVTVVCADTFPGTDFGQKVSNALAAIYAVGGGTVDARNFVCPAACHIGTANLTFGDGSTDTTTYLPPGVITRDVIAASGLSAQVFYNNGATVIGQGLFATTIEGLSDVTAVTQSPTGNVSNAALSDFSIQDTGAVTLGSVALQVGGPSSTGALNSPNVPNISYSNNFLQGAGGFQFWAGSTYHFAIFNYALTSSQVTTLYTTGITPGTGYPAAVEALSPLAYWPMTETSGTTMTDVVNGHNGTYVGGVTLGSAGGLPGDAGTTAPIFDGVTGNATYPTLNWFPNPDFTVMGWVEPTNGQGMQAFYIFQDVSGNNSASFADESSAWGGMYGRIEIGGNVTRTIFNRAVVGTGSLVFFTYVQHLGQLSLYLNGILQRSGGDVSSSTFRNISTSGADKGISLNGQAGCICYNKFYNMWPGGHSLGIESINNSGYGFGVNSNYWETPHTSAPLAIYDAGGTVNEYAGVPDIENSFWPGSASAVEAEPTSGYAGSSYVKGDVVTATLGCSVNPTFKVTYIGAAGNVGSDASPTQQGIVLVTGGSGCPVGTTSSVATTGGSGTGLKLNVHVSGTGVFVGFATKIGLTYQEAGASIYVCGGGNWFSTIGQTGNGGFFQPVFCPGTNTSYQGPASNFLWGPGATPGSIGLNASGSNYPYIAFGSPFMYDPLLASAYVPTTAAPNVFGNGPAFPGNAAITYGMWGSAEWDEGVNKPHAGTISTGKSTFGQLANPAAPTLTAVGGTGTSSADYGLVCIDGNGGHTAVVNPVTTVSGPATLGAFLTMSVYSGDQRVSGTVTATGTAVTWSSGATFNSTGNWPGETITINGQANTVLSVGSSTSLTLSATVAGGPYASPVAYSIEDAYGQADVGTHVSLQPISTFGSGAQATITQVNNGTGSGPVTGISLYAAGSGYVTLPLPGGSSAAKFSTTGGSGSGLKIGGTSSYIQVALPHTNGCQAWQVLAGDTSHILTSPANYGTGTTDLSSNVLDFGNAYGSISFTTVRNTTGDMVISNSTTPSSSTDGCTAGTIAWDASYVYVCTTTNNWKRSALSSF